MFRFACFPVLALAVCFGAVALQAEESVSIDPAKAAQLRRQEPLTTDMVDVFVQSGQLTEEQAAYVKKHISSDGRLDLPAEAVAPETPREHAPKRPAGLYADFNYRLDSRDQERLRESIREFRHSHNRAAIGNELRKFRPEVNALVAEAYPEAIDVNLKIELWDEVAGPLNPDAAIGLFETHRLLMEVAKPVLIPYAKDAGGAVVRRARPEPDAKSQKVFSSRELRDMIEKTEEVIARCAGPSAAIFLMNVYSQRYGEGEAPMRDCKRDRHRLVEACGGNPKDFDEDKHSTWSSTLSQRQRALIADKLIPWLDRRSDDRRQIARNGLMICLPRPHPDWEAGYSEWERWWAANKERLLAEK